MAGSFEVVNPRANVALAMAVRPTVIWPDPRLREPTVAITTVDDSVRELYRDLCDSMYAENGLGMAAPQIGDSRKMFIVEPKLAGLAETAPPVCLMNPEVIEVSDDQQDSEEGCLSFPDIYIKVKRPMRCKVRYMGLDGQMHEIDGEALMSRCLLHENDHLTGKLLVDFVGPLKRQMIKKKLQRVKDADADEASG
jgi:peptide deformylase